METARLAGLRSTNDPAEVKKKLNRQFLPAEVLPALEFPYANIETGSPTGESRFRFDKPSLHNPEYEESIAGHAEAHGPITDEPSSLPFPKYLWPRNTPTRVYAPVKIRPEIRDPSHTLFITEGEKKALAGCQSGLATIGLAGVYGFLDGTTRALSKGVGQDVKRLHPDFNLLDLDGREVVIAYDSDIDTNPNVLKAAVTLGKLLTEAGASVQITYLNPPQRAPAEHKVGLDDILAGLDEQERRGNGLLKLLEVSQRPFNVVEAVEYLEDHWDDWSATQRARELGREVRRAQLVLPNKWDLDKWCNRVAKALDLKVGEVKSHAVEQKQARTATDPREFLQRWLDARKAVYDYAHDAILLWGRSQPMDLISSEMALDGAKVGVREKGLGHALKLWVHDQRRAVIGRVRTKFAYRPGLSNLQIRRWARAVTGAENALSVAVVTHLIWQVKRKLHGMPVEHHLMLVLHGKQGSGKTEAVKALLKPLWLLVDMPGDLTILGDERQVFRQEQYFVTFFDEMAKADKVSVDALKNRITAVRVQWRVLGANSSRTATNNTTFLGATNEDLRDIIYDPSGMRRFHQMETIDRLNWQEINAIDYEELWSSVDHRAACPLLAVMPELVEHQADLRAKDTVEEWYEEHCAESTEWIAAKDLFGHYCDQMRKQMRKAMSQTKFGRRLTSIVEERIGREGEGWKMSDGKKYAVKLTGDAPVVPPAEFYEKYGDPAK